MSRDGQDGKMKGGEILKKIIPSIGTRTSTANSNKRFSRTFRLTNNGIPNANKYVRNIICNQKYSIYSFPIYFLKEQLHYFFNVFFVLVGLSQLFSVFRVDNSFTYFAPLSAVLLVTMLKEALADFRRYQRDQEANSQMYRRMAGGQFESIPSSAIRVGDILMLEKGQRIPADVVLLRAHESSGSVFIKTDQLDGETDWKLRVAIPAFQRLSSDYDVASLDAELYAEAPHKDIYNFIGTIRYRTNMSVYADECETFGLSVEHTLWMNTVLASGTVIGVVVYTGKDTRAIMNTSAPKSKSSLIEKELSFMTFVLFLVAAALALSLALCRVSSPLWPLYFVRFIILFSYVIPVSLRINVDMARILFNRWIEGDLEIANTSVRSVNICEELGRIGYLLTDKTGTLTKNDMEMRKIHMGTISFETDSSASEIRNNLMLAAVKLKSNSFSAEHLLSQDQHHFMTGRGRRDIHYRLFDVAQALAVCHNVTPSFEENEMFYQASSPDEVAIVKWTETVGMTLYYRDRERIKLRIGDDDELLEFEILHLFPFTSESKRMGILVRDFQTNEIIFYQKGADSVMGQIVQKSDWLDEECGNMAREGLRTLVIGRKKLSEAELAAFEEKYHEAKTSIMDRNEKIQQVTGELLERDLELLALTGVEDKLQEDVKRALELLRQAKIRVWMLTGDKVETATCIALSSKLVARNQTIYTLQNVVELEAIEDAVRNLSHRYDNCLVIDGQSLQNIIDHYPDEFIQHASQMSAVVCCRCSPTQKATVTELIKKHTKQVVCCIGDGGNDVSMIQSANVGIGIVGKEGKQAALASDISVTQFSHILRLFFWHGRSCYKSTAKVAQFVIHRGVILTVMQAVFSGIFYVAPITLYKGGLTVGYSTIFTMFPVFSLVLDHDVSSQVAMMYPELYKELVKGRCLSTKTFFHWMCKSVYQGGVIMLSTLYFFGYELLHMAAITFSALILNELIMIALEVHTWHFLMVVAECFSLLCSFISIVFFKEYFNIDYQDKKTFALNMLVSSCISFLPFVAIKLFQKIVVPPSYTKLK